MKYEGPLYGKIGRKAFDTGKTSQDWDRLERESKALKWCLLKLKSHHTTKRGITALIKETEDLANVRISDREGETL